MKEKRLSKAAAAEVGGGQTTSTLSTFTFDFLSNKFQHEKAMYAVQVDLKCCVNE